MAALDYLHGLPSIVPLNIAVDPALARWPTLNVMLPGVALRAMSGGPNTLIQITHRLADRGVRVRYISTDTPADKDHGPIWAHCSALTGIPGRPADAEIRCGFDRSTPMALGENDMFIASAWWNVQMIKYALPQFRVKQFLYTIQEFEPGLYPWSSEYALSTETYSLDFVGLINQRFVLDYLVRNQVGRFSNPDFARENCVVFEPALDRTKFFLGPEGQGREKRRLIFYARPESAKRNLFELGLYALRTAVAKGVFSGESWEMWFVGEQLPEADLGGVTIKSMPWLGFDDYARFVRGTDISLSLMLSPHTSYLPLETAASGGVCVTSVFANKNSGALADLHPNIIGVDPWLDPVVEGLREAVARVRRGGTPPPLPLPESWDSALDGVVHRCLEEFRSQALKVA